MAAHFLETNPDIRQYIFDQMTNVNMAVGVGQSRGYQNFSHYFLLRTYKISPRC